MNYTICTTSKTLTINEQCVLKELDDLITKLTKSEIIDSTWSLGINSNYAITYPLQPYYYHNDNIFNDNDFNVKCTCNSTACICKN